MNFDFVVKNIEKLVGGLNPTSARQVVSAAKNFSKETGMNPSIVPADVETVRAIINSKTNWRQNGFGSPEAWENWRSNVLRSVRLSAPQKVGAGGVMPGSYPPAWKAVDMRIADAFENGDDSRFSQMQFRAIAAKAIRQGVVDPKLVTDDVVTRAVEEYREAHRLAGGYLEVPEHLARAVAGWNRLVRMSIQGMPKTELSPVRQSGKKNVQDAEFHPSLKAELDDLVHKMRTGGGRRSRIRVAVGKKRRTSRNKKKVGDVLSESAIKSTRAGIRLSVTAAVGAGAKLSSLKSLKQVVSPDAITAAMQLGVDRLEEEQKSVETGSLMTVGLGIRRALEWSGGTPEELDEVDEILDEVEFDGRFKMAESRRLMLEKFRDESAVDLWYLMPDLLEKRAYETKREHGFTPAAIADMECAVLSSLFADTSPLRRTNAIGLRIGGDAPTLFISRRKGDASVIRIPGGEVKNNKPITAELDERTDELARKYVDEWRPDQMRRLGVEDSPFLFPGRSTLFRMSGAREIGSLAEAFSKRWEQHGLKVPMHLARHIAAKIILDFDSELVSVVAGTLGDKEDTVKAYYIDNDTSRDTRKYSKIAKARLSKTRDRYRGFGVA